MNGVGGVTGGSEARAERGTAALRSPVTWALLGLIVQRPSYGYELVQRFERAYDDTLELSSASQVYTAIDALERRGLIERLAPEQEAERQPKPHYRATERGLDAYRDWLVSHVHDERRRSRLFALQLAQLAPAEALTVLDSYERACLSEASGTPAAAAEAPTDGPASLAARMVLEDERLAIEARLAWIQYVRAQLHAPAPRRRGAAR